MAKQEAKEAEVVLTVEQKVDMILRWIQGVPPSEENPNGVPGAVHRIEAIDSAAMAALYTLSLTKDGISTPEGTDSSVVSKAQDGIVQYQKWQRLIQEHLNDENEAKETTDGGSGKK